MPNFKWPSIYRVACPIYLWNLHFSLGSEGRNARVTFVEKPQMKIISFQNGKHGYLIQYLIRQSFEGFVVNQNRNYVCSHFKTLNWFYINLTALYPSTPHGCPPQGERIGGGAGALPPSYAPKFIHCKNTLYITNLRLNEKFLKEK